MSERTFTPYEGWESDVDGLAHHTADAWHRAPAMEDSALARARRLLAAFEPPTCGKVLHWESAPGRWTGCGRSDVICTLPLGHHPYTEGTGLVGQWCEFRFDEDTICGAAAHDPIHSPGHVADVPEDAWR